METRHQELERFLSIRVVAALSVVVLVVTALWQAYGVLAKGKPITATNPAAESLSERAATPYGSVNWQAPLAGEAESFLAADDPDGIGNIADNVVGALVGSYVTLADAGSYTQEEGEKIAGDIAESLRASVSYKVYSTADLKTDTDASYERMLSYRSDLRVALEPLLKNPGYELSLFANYIETNDTTYLEQLRTAVQNYQQAIKNTENVVVPEDAAPQHVGILNALSEFSATIEQMAGHANDAFASAALLRTYNESEANLLTSFNTLATYYRSKQL